MLKIKFLFSMMCLLLFFTVNSQCITGTPPLLTCGTQINVADGTVSGLYGTASQSAPTCRGSEKYTYSDLYRVIYQPGTVVEINSEGFMGFLAVLSADGCTTYNCEVIDASGINISGESFIQDATSLNGIMRFTIGLDDIGLVAGQTYIIKYCSIANCGGSPCNSASIGTTRAYNINCYSKPESSCSNAVGISGNTVYSVTNNHAADNGADFNGAGIDCGYSIESNIMYRWCTDAVNTPVQVQLSNVTIHTGTSIQFAILSGACGTNFGAVQCQSGITGTTTFNITGTSANTCYWISLDGNAGTWFTTNIQIINATILPVELVYFNGRVLGSDVKLEWKTLTEINNDYFEIYGSRDGVDFEYIDRIKGSGNSTTTKIYQFTDKNRQINDYYYYKLKQVDYDGEFKYSDIISVSKTRVGVDKHVVKIVNILGKDTEMDSDGLKIIIYSDGSYEKTY